MNSQIIPPGPATRPAPSAPGGQTRRQLLWFSRALTWLLYAYVLVCEVLLLIGFVLRLFGANPSAGFVQWTYRSLERVMAPFRGIFAPIELGVTAADVPAVLDTSILFAMLIYGIVLLALRALIDWLTFRLLAEPQRVRPAGAVPLATTPHSTSPYSTSPEDR